MNKFPHFFRIYSKLSARKKITPCAIERRDLHGFVKLCIPLLGCTKRCDINSTVTSRSSRDTRTQQVNVKVRSPSWFHVADLKSPPAPQPPPRPGLHVCHTHTATTRAQETSMGSAFCARTLGVGKLDGASLETLQPTLTYTTPVEQHSVCTMW